MKSPDLAMATDSLAHSLRNCSLNHRLTSPAAAASSAGVRRFSSSSSSSSSSSYEPHECHHLHQNHGFDPTLELNSHVSLPPYWEQCLDLKTGELYYINCRTGMKVKEDPRTADEHIVNLFPDEDDSSGDDSEESSSSSITSRKHHRPENADDDNVLVVAGCKRCFMYFMVAKQVEECPKCGFQLVHFDRSEDGFP